jgi:hypothetical protein
MGVGVDGGGAQIGVRAGGVGREQRPESRAGLEQPDDGAVDHGLVEVAPADGGRQLGIGVAAVQVVTGREGGGRGRRVVEAEIVELGHVVDRVAVGDDEPLEAPIAAQGLVQQQRRGACREAVDGVVCAHHRPRSTLDHRLTEGWQVGGLQVLRRHVDVEPVAAGLGPGMDREVLGRGDGAGVFGIRSLDPAHEGCGQRPGQVRVLAIGLLPSAPAGVTIDVDVRRPQGQALIAAWIAVADGIELGPGFDRHCLADPAHQALVPRRGQADGLREHRGRAVAGQAVQALVPPLVAADPEPRNWRRGALQLGGLLLETQARDQDRRRLGGLNGGG